MKIVLTIGVLLLVGMFLINFVTVIIGQREYIRDEIERGEALITLIASRIAAEDDLRRLAEVTVDRGGIDNVLSRFGYTHISIFDDGGTRIYSRGAAAGHDESLRRLGIQAQRRQGFVSRLAGSTWSVFWRHNQALQISAPVLSKGSAVGSVALLHPLEDYYARLRQSQKFVMFYMVVNVAILSLAGLFRIYQLTLKPVNKLVKRAEEYTDDTSMAFAYEKDESEFGLLSKALNSMLTRISRDKATLKSSLESLEQANAEIKRAQTEIIMAEKLASVGRLAAGIAHEIGNPIGIVLGYLGLLRETDDDSERRDFLNRAENEINRIKTIIRQLLDFSRPSASEVGRVSLHELIHEVVDILRVQPLMDAVEIRTDLKAESDTVKMDASQLRQVFVNLMINAADAIKSGPNGRSGDILITTDSEPSEGDVSEGSRRIRVRIIDNGPGIPQEHIPNIFDPFFTTKEPGKGTGLGLSVSFMIIEQAGGTMQAENPAEGGTVMTVNLPLT